MVSVYKCVISTDKLIITLMATTSFNKDHEYNVYFSKCQSSDLICFNQIGLSTLSECCTFLELSINYKNLDFPLLSISILDNGILRDLTGFLFTENDVAFENSFSRKAERTGFVQLDYFAAWQINKYFRGSSCYICSSRVVLGYKAVEINDKELLLEVDNILSSSEQLINDCVIDWHPRKNKEHLRVSILCSQWHVKLALRDKVGFLHIMKEIESSIVNVSNFFTPSYPITLSLLIYTSYFYLLKEFDRSKTIAYEAAAVFKRAVKDSDFGRVTLFGELNVSHKAAQNALQLAQRTNYTEEQFKEKVLTSFRVKGKVLERLYDDFKFITNGNR